MSELVERFKAFASQWVKGTFRDDVIYMFTDNTGTYVIKASDLVKAAARIEELEAALRRLAEAPHSGWTIAQTMARQVLGKQEDK